MGFWYKFMVFYGIMDAFTWWFVESMTVSPTLLFVSAAVLMITGETTGGDATGILLVTSGMYVLVQVVVASILASLGTGSLRFLAF